MMISTSTDTGLDTGIGDILAALKPQDLRIAPSAAYVGSRTVYGDSTLAARGVPSNQQILDATRAFYDRFQPLVDRSTLDTKSGAQNNPRFVRTMNGFNWRNQRLTQAETDTTSTGIGLNDGGSGGGIWGPTLDMVKASQLFTTIGVGITADVQFFVGGAGGLGAVFDTAKREGPRGYGYATGELGLRVTSELNVQCVILNELPSALNKNIYGLKVSISPGISLSFQVLFKAPGTTILGYAIGAGVGLGGGATVFGGHIWNFG